jgi:hypothetical protein
MMQLDGFGMPAYRSFGEGIQYLGPLEKINLLIGQNNSGKSNVLQFVIKELAEASSAARTDKSYRGIAEEDRHIGARYDRLRFAFGLALEGPAHQALVERLSGLSAQGSIFTSLDKILRSDALGGNGEVAWFEYESNRHGELVLSESLVTGIQSVLNPHEWADIWNAFTGKGRGNLANWVPESIHAISPVQWGVPTVAFVPAIREVRIKGEANIFSGAGIIERLAQLQNPGHKDQALKLIFGKINRFLQRVVDSESAAIEIPAQRDTILVHLNGRTLPLASLGTGIHEVVILASAATVISDQLVCIEEPEIHLHPLLQRKLLEHLREETNNQYLIATHSGHFLDDRKASIFHIQLREGRSFVKRAVAANERFNVCVDLGYRSSDLLQSNCIIWVEGPSDRIYLRHWLRQLAPDLLEGAHFSLMFYGGRLLSHLTAEDPEVIDFISLRRLNRFISIVIDSDRAKPRQALNATKDRVKREFNKGPGHAWITAGREIENYVPNSTLRQAVQSVHKSAYKIPEANRFDDALSYSNRQGSVKGADKVKVACEVTKQAHALDMLDLRRQLERLIAFIRQANGA